MAGVGTTEAAVTCVVRVRGERPPAAQPRAFGTEHVAPPGTPRGGWIPVRRLVEARGWVSRAQAPQGHPRFQLKSLRELCTRGFRAVRRVTLTSGSWQGWPQAPGTTGRAGTPAPKDLRPAPAGTTCLKTHTSGGPHTRAHAEPQSQPQVGPGCERRPQGLAPWVLPSARCPARSPCPAAWQARPPGGQDGPGSSEQAVLPPPHPCPQDSGGLGASSQPGAHSPPGQALPLSSPRSSHRLAQSGGHVQFPKAPPPSWLQPSASSRVWWTDPGVKMVLQLGEGEGRGGPSPFPTTTQLASRGAPPLHLSFLVGLMLLREHR